MPRRELSGGGVKREGVEDVRRDDVAPQPSESVHRFDASPVRQTNACFVSCIFAQHVPLCGLELFSDRTMARSFKTSKVTLPSHVSCNGRRLVARSLERM